MRDERIQIRGNKDGINAIIDIEKFPTFEIFSEAIVNVLSERKGFYKNSVLKITGNFKNVKDDEIACLKDQLFDKINIKDCIFDDINITKDEAIKGFNGINEGKTKFIRSTVRGGQTVDFPGNVVIIGDVNSGAEVICSGNIIVLGSIKGRVKAGRGGSRDAIIAAFSMQPELIQICDIISFAPDGVEKPDYPEVAKIKDGTIIVEPYLTNKYIY